MATIVNNPAPTNNSGSGLGMIIGLVILAFFVVLFFIYGIPALQQLRAPQINPQITVPDKIDVNINK